MKRIILKSALTIFLTALSFTGFSQAPQKMSYQAVIRNNSNALVTSTPVGMKISILQGTPTGTLVYAETQTITTNVNGLASLEIGAGAVVGGTFTAINWANGPYFIKTEVDPNGGASYNITGTSQLLSVPFALYAEKTAVEKTAFSAYATTNQTLTSSGYVDFGSEDYDDGSMFSNNTYTAQTSGIYHFNSHVRLAGDASAGQYMWIGINVNGNLVKDCTSQTSMNTYGINISVDLKLNAGDQVKIWLQHASGPAYIQSNSYNTWFSGHKVYSN
ncbi:MAG: hypothetical protein JNM96_07705 [Bacteroidia bacterium]|nr:hypothetical protein [Bacteroidia bacterium]